mmetsp:Transcript_23440/g.36113  ORF Transcript_23440/g.36113 Transcript_23440/m.36113 type:complete len:89 (+) Transcript_23440:4625-4891(+)
MVERSLEGGTGLFVFKQDSRMNPEKAIQILKQNEEYFYSPANQRMQANLSNIQSPLLNFDINSDSTVHGNVQKMQVPEPATLPPFGTS